MTEDDVKRLVLLLRESLGSVRSAEALDSRYAASSGASYRKNLTQRVEAELEKWKSQWPD